MTSWRLAFPFSQWASNYCPCDRLHRTAVFSTESHEADLRRMGLLASAIRDTVSPVILAFGDAAQGQREESWVLIMPSWQLGGICMSAPRLK